MDSENIAPPAYHSGATRFTDAQVSPLDTAADNGEELSWSHQEQSLNRGLTQDTTTEQRARRQHDCPSANGLSPLKRVQATQKDPVQPGHLPSQAAQVILQPTPTKRPYASFLEDFIDPVHSHPCPDSLHTFVSLWLDSVGTNREKFCRSDTHLNCSDGDLVPRHLTRSAPEMSGTRGRGAFQPRLTASRASARNTASGSPAADESASQTPATSTTATGTRNRFYREKNLLPNKIYIRESELPLPSAVAVHIDDMLRSTLDLPKLSVKELNTCMRALDSFITTGCNERDVADFLQQKVFGPSEAAVDARQMGLKGTSESSLGKHLVPKDPQALFRVSQPRPDKLYGYTVKAFTESQVQAKSMFNPATATCVSFPFLTIDIKAQGGTAGDLCWVAVNQCAGASSACLNATDQLNISLQQCQSTQRVLNLCYSIAVDNSTAQIWISWKENEATYYLQRVATFLLLDREHFQKFCDQVRNILDWGMGARLTQIRNALDAISGDGMAGEGC